MNDTQIEDIRTNYYFSREGNISTQLIWVTDSCNYFVKVKGIIPGWPDSWSFLKRCTKDRISLEVTCLEIGFGTLCRLQKIRFIIPRPHVSNLTSNKHFSSDPAGHRHLNFLRAILKVSTCKYGSRLYIRKYVPHETYMYTC